MTQEDDLRREIEQLAGKVDELSERLENEPVRQLALSTKLDDIAERLDQLTGVLDNLRAGEVEADVLFDPVVQALADLRGEVGTLRPPVPTIGEQERERNESAERLAQALRFQTDDPDAGFQAFPVPDGGPALREGQPVVLVEGEPAKALIYGRGLGRDAEVTVDGVPVEILNAYPDHLLVEGRAGLRIGAPVAIRLPGGQVFNHEIEQQGR